MVVYIELGYEQLDAILLLGGHNFSLKDAWEWYILDFFGTGSVVVSYISGWYVGMINIILRIVYNPMYFTSKLFVSAQIDHPTQMFVVLKITVFYHLSNCMVLGLG